MERGLLRSGAVRKMNGYRVDKKRRITQLGAARFVDLNIESQKKDEKF
jgi:hypothetical protein